MRHALIRRGRRADAGRTLHHRVVDLFGQRRSRRRVARQANNLFATSYIIDSDISSSMIEKVDVIEDAGVGTQGFLQFGFDLSQLTLIHGRAEVVGPGAFIIGHEARGEGSAELRCLGRVSGLTVGDLIGQQQQGCSNHRDTQQNERTNFGAEARHDAVPFVKEVAPRQAPWRLSSAVACNSLVGGLLLLSLVVLLSL